MTSPPKKPAARKGAAKPGRAKLTDHKAHDGRRLAKAIKTLELTEPEVVESSGITASHLNDVIEGRDSLSLEDLRALTIGVGVSADYLLGFPGATVTVGELRTQDLRASLVAHLRAEVERACIAFPVPVASPERINPDRVAPGLDRGDTILTRLVDAVIEEVRLLQEYEAAFQGLAYAQAKLTQIKMEGGQNRTSAAVAIDGLLDTAWMGLKRPAVVFLAPPGAVNGERPNHVLSEEQFRAYRQEVRRLQQEAATLAEQR